MNEFICVLNTGLFKPIIPIFNYSPPADERGELRGVPSEPAGSGFVAGISKAPATIFNIGHHSEFLCPL
jgi:hypothetical protein